MGAVVKLDESTIDWLFAATGWWLAEFGPVEDTSLVLPTEEDFPTRDPLEMLGLVAELSGMGSWKFELVPASEIDLGDPMPQGVPRPAAPKAVLVADQDQPLGNDSPMPIPFSLEDAANPVALISSFARSVSYYLLGQARDEVPGGEENLEYAVDLGAIMLGFGVFVANASFEFSRYQQGLVTGWSSSRRGELSEWAVGYALAMYVGLADADERSVLKHLDANPKSTFKAARKDLRRSRARDFERLRAVEPRPTNEGPYR